MTKRDYEAAALIVQDIPTGPQEDCPWLASAVRDAFVELFKRNPAFDEARFRRACVPGANVRARG